MKSPPLERRVLDALPITIYAVDLDGRLTFLNRSWARFAQSNGAPELCDERAVLGSSIWDAIPDGAVRAQVEQAL
ncbi:MAG TPA: PAS domain-containing protein, partial [Gemmatimonadaceae bacterium]|nr:PAS domain-containing protein [Gemmatimonadaceae bacterium]